MAEMMFNLRSAIHIEVRKEIKRISEDLDFLEFLYNQINPNEMEWYRSMWESARKHPFEPPVKGEEE